MTHMMPHVNQGKLPLDFMDGIMQISIRHPLCAILCVLLVLYVQLVDTPRQHAPPHLIHHASIVCRARIAQLQLQQHVPPVQLEVTLLFQEQHPSLIVYYAPLVNFRYPSVPPIHQPV